MPPKKYPILNDKDEVLGYIHSGFHNSMKSLHPTIGKIGMGIINKLIRNRFGGANSSMYIDDKDVMNPRHDIDDSDHEMQGEELLSILDSFIMDPPVKKGRKSKIEEELDMHAEQQLDQPDYEEKKKTKKIGLKRPQMTEGPIPEIILK